MAANTTITDDLRQRLAALAGPDRSADDLANEVLSEFVKRQEAATELAALSAWGREQSKRMGHKPSDVIQAIKESRSERRRGR